MKNHQQKDSHSSIKIGSESILPHRYLRNYFIIVIYLAFSGMLTVQSLQAKTRENNDLKCYVAKIYFNENDWVKGILYSVDDSSITLCIDTAFTKNDPLNDSLKMITIPYQDINKIKVIRKGAMEKGFLIGALSGGLPGLLLGAGANAGAQGMGATMHLASFGAVESESTGGLVGVFAFTGIVVGGGIGLAAGSGSRKYYIIYNREWFTAQKENLRHYSLKWMTDNGKG